MSDSGRESLNDLQEKEMSPETLDKDLAPQEKLVEKEKKKERKKDDVEHVLKALNSLNTTEEKLAAMCKKYADLFNDHRLLQNAMKQTERKCTVLLREREHLQSEQSKATLTRTRLENLCRELQRQNKAVKEESLMRIREEEEKRKEVSAKFQKSLNEITVMMQENDEKNNKLKEDNIGMAKKLQHIVEQYEKREQNIDKLAKQMSLEIQLTEDKLTKAKLEMAVEKEKMLAEKEKLLSDLSELKCKYEAKEAMEVSLKSQISLYNSKYEEFHTALLQSNKCITGFKSEMEKMTKQIKKLERDTALWRQRYEQAHVSLVKITEEKLKSDQDLGVAQRKLGALQNLCRTLQNHCVQMRNELKVLKGELDEDALNEKTEEDLCNFTEAQDEALCPLAPQKIPPPPPIEEPEEVKSEPVDEPPKTEEDGEVSSILSQAEESNEKEYVANGCQTEPETKPVTPQISQPPQDKHKCNKHKKRSKNKNNS